MKAYMCVICGYVYEEEKGDPASGIAAGTRWDDVPLSWRCPDCGAGKEDVEMVEVGARSLDDAKAHRLVRAVPVDLHALSAA